MKKQGTVLLIGRPNVGKSTFLNNLIGQKVAITSPKPQTTRFPIQAVYSDERGQIIFVDTPGVHEKTSDQLSKRLNRATFETLHSQIDAVIYMVDHTRKRDREEARVLGIVRKLDKPKILVINKEDLQEKSFMPQYEFLADEFPYIFKISAINKSHVAPLMDRLFELLPDEGKEHVVVADTPSHILNVDSKTYIAELIREKVFLKTGQEIPYTVTVIVDEITDRKDGLVYIKARILTTHDRYKKILIGKEGRKIKEFGSMARKEIELALNKKVYLDLKVETDPHWQELYS